MYQESYLLKKKSYLSITINTKQDKVGISSTFFKCVVGAAAHLLTCVCVLHGFTYKV